jgi:hypothetical protein
MRFEEQVAILSAQALAAHDEAEVQRLLAELRLVLHQRIEELRAGLLSAYSASMARSKVIGIGAHLRRVEPGTMAGKPDHACGAPRTWQQVVEEISREDDHRRALQLTQELNRLLQRHAESPGEHEKLA